jgi:hypothetical protein
VRYLTLFRNRFVFKSTNIYFLIITFISSFFLLNTVLLSQDDDMLEFNCQNAPCENPESHFINVTFPGPGPCPDCDFNVWLRYDICPGPPLTIHLEIMAAGTTEYFGDPNICATCDWKV